jgi:hypothetical protein
VVERRGAEDLGDREAQDVRDLGERGLGQPSEAVLDGVEHRQERGWLGKEAAEISGLEENRRLFEHRGEPERKSCASGRRGLIRVRS